MGVVEEVDMLASVEVPLEEVVEEGRMRVQAQVELGLVQERDRHKLLELQPKLEEGLRKIVGPHNRELQINNLKKYKSQ